MAQFKLKGGSSFKASPPKFNPGGGGSNSIQMLIARDQMARQREQNQPQLGASEHIMKKASEDVLKLSQSYKFIEELENDYNAAYEGKDIGTGLQGGVGATKEYGTGVLGRQNEPLRRYVRNREASGVAIGRFSGDVGNFAWQEQLAHLKRLPLASPNLKLENLGMPDDPQFGKTLFADIKNIYAKKMVEAAEVARTGVPPNDSGYLQWLSSQNSANPTQGASPIPGMQQQGGQDFSEERQQALDAIKRGAPEAKVRDVFRSRTGQEL